MPEEPDSNNKTFDFDSGLNSTETVAAADVEYGTEVLEDLERLNLNNSNEGQARSPLSELSLEEVEKANATRIPEIDSVKIETIDTVTRTNPDGENKEIVAQVTEESTLEVSADPKIIANTTFEANSELKPENTPLPADDFEDLSSFEENQENIPPIEIKFNASVTETVAVIETKESPSLQESTFEGDTAIFVGGKLDLTGDKSKSSLDEAPPPVKDELKSQADTVEAAVVSEEIPVPEKPAEKVLTYQESFDERPVKGVIHSESLAAFERIEAEINSDTKNFETPLSIDVEAVPLQTEQEKADSHPEEPTFIVGTMPESKDIPMDVDEEMFDFPPPPPKEMLDEMEQTTACVAGKTSTSPLNGFNSSDGRSEVFVEDFSTVSLDATFKKPSAPPAFSNKRRSEEKLQKNLDDEEFHSSAGCKNFYFIFITLFAPFSFFHKILFFNCFDRNCLRLHLSKFSNHHPFKGRSF